MPQQGQNYAIVEWDAALNEGKTFLAASLGLTGTQISRTVHQPGRGSTFVHAHRRNEEVYIVTHGQGWLYIDGAEVPIRAGDVVRVSCAGRRALRADDEQPLVYYCVQADTGSLVQETKQDGYKLAELASWMVGPQAP